MSEKEIDQVTGVETTGHEWDGVKELNNPMPRWWLSIMYATIVWSAIYTIFYPAWPLVTEATAGLLGYTARGELAETIAEHEAGQSVWREQIASADFETIRTDPELFRFANAAGGANFALYCAQCHGAGAAGNPGGYPNLQDDSWIWGGTLEDIQHTITHGVRNEDDPDARFAEMPRYGVDELLTREEIQAVAQHVLAFTDRADEPEKLELGAEVFADNCAACHGEEGKGDPFAGAPNISDGIWLYGGEKADILAQIHAPQQGVMPHWGEKFSEEEIKELALYVHSLGGGQ